MNNLEFDKVLANSQIYLKDYEDTKSLVYCSSAKDNSQTIIYAFNSLEEANDFVQKQNELAWGDYFANLLKENEI